MNRSLGKIESNEFLSESYYWLNAYSERFDLSIIAEKLRGWKEMKPFQLTELIFLLHKYGPHSLLIEMAGDKKMYAAPGPRFKSGPEYGHQAEVVLFGLVDRKKIQPSPGVDTVFLQILRTLANAKAFQVNSFTFSPLSRFLEQYTEKGFPKKTETWAEFALLARILTGRWRKSEKKLLGNENSMDDYHKNEYKKSISLLNTWADSLEQEFDKKTKKKAKQKPKSKTVKKRRRK